MALHWITILFWVIIGGISSIVAFIAFAYVIKDTNILMSTNDTNVNEYDGKKFKGIRIHWYH